MTLALAALPTLTPRPHSNQPLTIANDLQFLTSDKPYMAAASPLYFAHYGKEGDWAFDKNYIYRSDDLLFPTRWGQIMSMAGRHSPEMVQVISWNDYGESHYIGPVMGAEPGSQGWTRNMPHGVFLEMTNYYAGRWRDGRPEVGNEIVVWMWYRTHPKDLKIKFDEIGRPEHADWVSWASKRGRLGGLRPRG